MTLGKVCEEHTGHEDSCIRCLQLGLEPNKIKGGELCDEHKGTKVPCKICLVKNPDNVSRGRDKNGLCDFHGAKVKMCEECRKNQAHTKGLCRSCTPKEERKCVTEDCPNTMKTEGKLYRTCYRLKTGKLKKCDNEDCDNNTKNIYDLCKKCYDEIQYEKLTLRDEIAYNEKGNSLCIFVECTTPARPGRKFCYRHSPDTEYKRSVIKQQLEYQRNKYKNDPRYRMKRILRSRFYEVVTEEYKSKSVMKLLGCEIQELKEHIEKQFVEGMSWENYGEWHVDHIRPCSSFDLNDDEHQKTCFHYKNMQPLWGKDNMSKGSRWEEELEKELELSN